VIIMKVACVLITHLPIKSELRRHLQLRGKAAIVTVQSSSGPKVLDASPEASGVASGMPLQEALSRCKDAALIEADEPHYRAVFNGVLESLSQRSPLVEKSELGCVYVGVNGLESIYGDEAGTVAALLKSVPHEYNARIGLAEAKFPAYVAAVLSEGGRATWVPDDVGGFLADLTVDLLPISWESRTRLHQFGLHTMGRMASLSLGSLQAQFGAEGKLAWELSNGIDPSWLLPLKHEEVVSESLSFPSPAATLYAIMLAVEVLLGRAFAHPSIRGRYVRIMSMEGRVLHKPPWTRSFAFKEPVNSKARALVRVRSSLEALELPGPLEDMSLTLSGITGESGLQSSLFSDVRKQDQLRDMMRQLEARLHTRPPIYKVMELEPWSRFPERRQALVQFEP